MWGWPSSTSSRGPRGACKLKVPAERICHSHLLRGSALDLEELRIADENADAVCSRRGDVQAVGEIYTGRVAARRLHESALHICTGPVYIHGAAKAVGCEKFYQEEISGGRSNRPDAKAIKAFGEGDVLVVCRLDRLARSTWDLLNILAEIADRGASFKSLGDAWADTTSAQGLLGTLRKSHLGSLLIADASSPEVVGAFRTYSPRLSILYSGT
jgi:hypothetical protein